MLKTVEVQEEMIGAVKAFLANREGFTDAGGWEGLFKYSWKRPEHPYGYAILDGERVVAFIGTIFSERVIAGKKQLCCNINTWYVEEEYRPRMLAVLVLNPILRMKDLVITALSSSDVSRPILEKMGFQTLDSEQVAIPVFPWDGWRIDAMRGSDAASEVTFEKTEIAKRLDGENHRIFLDHAGLQCEHFLIREKNGVGCCYGIATSTPTGKLRWLKGRWLNLCYLSNPAVLARNFQVLKRAMWRRRLFLLCCDARLLTDELAKMGTRKKKARQYKGNGVLAAGMDNLYSELVTFNKY